MRGRSEDEEDYFFLRGAAGGAGVGVFRVGVGCTWGLCIAVNGDLCSGLSGGCFHG